MISKKKCPKCGKRMVNVVRSRPVSVGRKRTMRCLDCLHEYNSIEMSATFLREHVLRGDEEALHALVRVIE